MTIRRAGLLAGSTLAFGVASAPLAVRADTHDAVSLPPKPVTIPGFASDPPERFSITPMIDNDGACMHAPTTPVSETALMGCPFDDTRAGLEFTSNTDTSFGEFTLRGSFGRRSEGGLGLDQQFTDYMPGTAREETFSAIGVESKLLDGRVKLASNFGWSKQWRAPLAADPHRPERFDRRNASMHSYDIDLQLVEQPKLKLSVNGSYSNAEGQYSSFAIAQPLAMFAMPGEKLQLGSRAKLGRLGLRANWHSQNNETYSLDQWKLAASHSGFTLSVKHKASSSDEFATAGTSALPSRRNAKSIALDFTPMVLFPLVAMDSDGWGALIPQTMTLELGNRENQRQRISGSEHVVADTVSATGMWSTPLGDTLITYDARSFRARENNDPRLDARDTTILVDHSFNLDRWKIGANVMRSSNSNGAASSASSDNNFTYYGLSASRRVKSGAMIDLSIGRDAVAFNSGGGDFLLRDRTTRVKATLDLTNMLRERFERDDLHLRIEGRLDLGKSGYELRFLDEVLEREFQSLSAQGVLLTFGMKLR